MNVHLIRHSLAVEPGSVPGGDAARPLTPEGRQRFTAISAWLTERGMRVDRLLHSPRVRAAQTAAILAGALGLTLGQVQELDWLGQDYDPRDLLEEIAGSGVESIAIVGHQPLMSECAERFIGGGNLMFSEGTVARIVFDGPVSEGAGDLRLLLDPTLFDA